MPSRFQSSSIHRPTDIPANIPTCYEVRVPPFHPQFSECIAAELRDSHGRNLLLVLDGFDEISCSLPETSVARCILCRQHLPECTIILTAKPSAKRQLEMVCKARIEKHVEIQGSRNSRE